MCRVRKNYTTMPYTLIIQPMMVSVIYHHDPLSLQRSWKVQLKFQVPSGSIVMMVSQGLSLCLWYKQTYCAAFCIKGAKCNRVEYVIMFLISIYVAGSFPFYYSLEYVLTLNFFLKSYMQRTVYRVTPVSASCHLCLLHLMATFENHVMCSASVF